MMIVTFHRGTEYRAITTKYESPEAMNLNLVTKQNKNTMYISMLASR